MGAFGGCGLEGYRICACCAGCDRNPRSIFGINVAGGMGRAGALKTRTENLVGVCRVGRQYVNSHGTLQEEMVNTLAPNFEPVEDVGKTEANMVVVVCDSQHHRATSQEPVNIKSSTRTSRQ